MNKYEKLCMVGRGAHGIVYLCQRVDDNCRVIIKEIPVEGMTVAQRQAALVETRVLQMLSHPNIIGYYEYFIENNSLCIVMQYAEGGTMADFLLQRKGRPVDEERVLQLFTQLLLALHHVHSKQIVHRDLKTQNILLNRARNICKLSDFGISKELMTQSKANTVIGTPQYLSPEVCSGRPYNQKSDMWALGCILYELATLRRAFEADTMPVLFDKIMRNPPASMGDHVSAELSQIVVMCLERDASRRPDTCQLLSHPLILACALRLATDLGTLPCPRTLKEPTTPTNSKKLKTRADSKNSTTSPQTSSGAVQGGSCKVMLVQGDTAHELSLQSRELEVGALVVRIRQTASNGQQHFAVTECGTLIVWTFESGTYQAQHMRTANVVSVAAGHSFYMLVNDQGMLYSWGSSERGCLGLGPNVQTVQQPAVVEPLITFAVTRVACAQAHVLALTDDHKLYAWGDNQYGQLGVPISTHPTVHTATLVQLDARAQIHSIHCSHHASAVVLVDGTVWAAGCNRFNKLGLSTATNTVKLADHFRQSSLPSVNLQLPQPFTLGVQHTALIHENKMYVMGCMNEGDKDNEQGNWLKERALQWDHRPRRLAAGLNCTFIVSNDQRLFKQTMAGNKPVISPVALPQLQDVLRKDVLHIRAYQHSLLVALRCW